jgi:hypothetical protein
MPAIPQQKYGKGKNDEQRDALKIHYGLNLRITMGQDHNRQDSMGCNATHVLSLTKYHVSHHAW